MIENDLDVLAPGKFRILLGSELARFLGAYVGGKVTVITPEASVTPPSAHTGCIPRWRPGPAPQRGRGVGRNPETPGTG